MGVDADVAELDARNGGGGGVDEESVPLRSHAGTRARGGSTGNSSTHSSVAANLDGFDTVELLDGRPSRSSDGLELNGTPAAGPAPKRRSQWWHVALLLIADTVGTGVLELPGNVRKLGWGPGMFLIVLFSPINLYTGWMLSRLSLRYPNALSYGELAGVAAGRRWAQMGHAFMATYFLSVLGGYVLVLAEAVQGLAVGKRLCLLPASVVSGLLLVMPVQLRSLHSLAGLSAVSAVTILLAVGICMVELMAGRGLGVHSDEGDGGVGAAPPPAQATEAGGGIGDYGDTVEEYVGPVWVANSSFMDKFTALTGIVFAYAGQSVFLEMIAEMCTPAHFPRALLAAAPFMVGIYLLVSLVGYGHLGAATPANIMESLPDGTVKRFANGFMLVHMVISYLITSQVLSRFIHVRVSPATVEDRGTRGRMHWAVISGGVLLWSIFVSNGVPFFDDLTGIIGSLMASNISFGMPAALALAAATRGVLQLSTLERVGQFALIAMTLVLMVLGLYSNLTHTVRDSKTWGMPFSCHAE